MERLFEQLLTLLFTWLGFSIMLRAVGVKTRPGRTLGRMIVGLVRGAWWLTKILFTASFDLLETIATGLPSPKTTTANVAHAFLTGFPRWRLIRRGHDGIVVDGRRSLSLDRSFRGAVICSPTGSGKTTSYLIVNALMLSGCSAVITDPSGEIYKASAGWLHRQGFQIKVFNVSDVAHSHFFNPLHRADSHTAIGQLASTLIDNAFAENRDQFWNSSAKSLLNVAIRALKTQKLEYANLYNLRYLLNNFGHDASNLNRVISGSLDESSFQEWKGILSNEKKVLASILSTCKAATEKVADPNVARLTASENLHFEDLRGPRPTVIYIIVEESKVRYFSFLTNLLIGQLFDFCMKPPRPGEPHLPILFLLDEFANLGRFPDFSATASQIRKHKCSISIVLQDVLQLENVYGKADASSIINGAMATKVFLSGLPHTTCEHLSRVIGKDEAGRSVFSAAEIRTLPDSTGLLIHGNRKPVLLDMVPFYKSRKLLARSRIPPPPLPVADISEPLPLLKL